MEDSKSSSGGKSLIKGKARQDDHTPAGEIAFDLYKMDQMMLSDHAHPYIAIQSPYYNKVMEDIHLHRQRY